MKLIASGVTLSAASVRSPLVFAVFVVDENNYLPRAIAAIPSSVESKRMSGSGSVTFGSSLEYWFQFFNFQFSIFNFRLTISNFQFSIFNLLASPPGDCLVRPDELFDVLPDQVHLDVELVAVLLPADRSSLGRVGDDGHGEAPPADGVDRERDPVQGHGPLGDQIAPEREGNVDIKDQGVPLPAASRELPGRRRHVP